MRDKKKYQSYNCPQKIGNEKKDVITLHLFLSKRQDNKRQDMVNSLNLAPNEKKSKIRDKMKYQSYTYPQKIENSGNKMR